MTRGRRHSFDQIAGLLRLIQVRIKEGKKLSQACFEAGITEYTFYRWQAECNLAFVNELKSTCCKTVEAG